MGQGFAIESDPFLFGGIDKFGIRKTERADGGVDLDVPESAEIAFLVTTMGKGVSSGVHQSVVGGSFVGGTAETEAFGGSED